MALIVEDGSGVTDSNTYSSLADTKAYYDLIGFDYSGYTDDQITAAKYRSMNYIETRSFYGVPSEKDQSLEWPRCGITYRGYSLDSDEIPTNLIRADQEATKIELESSGSLQESISRNVKKEKVDVIEVEYFSSGPRVEKLTIIDNLLKDLIYSSASIEINRG